MTLDQKAIIRQIDDILSKCAQGRAGEDAAAYAMAISAIRRLSPPGSIYVASLKGHEEALSRAGGPAFDLGVQRQPKRVPRSSRSLRRAGITEAESEQHMVSAASHPPFASRGRTKVVRSSTARHYFAGTKSNLPEDSS